MRHITFEDISRSNVGDDDMINQMLNPEHSIYELQEVLSKYGHI